MIFVTVGMRLPFDRLVRAMDEWAAAHPEEEVFGQILKRTQDCDSDPYLPEHFAYSAELDPRDFEDKCSRARCIVGHAGTGTLISAVTFAKPLVMMARRAAFREHRNDHQVATANRFRELPGVTLVDDTAELHEALNTVLSQSMATGGVASRASDGLISAIRSEILRGA